MQPATLTLLDMGDAKYGDSILCQLGGKTILVDGGHLYDDRPHGAYPSLPDQLKKLTGQWPLKVDLLVVTHCHADHIGCLPQLVAGGGLSATWALVADPNLGWGKVGGLPDFADAPTLWDAADSLDPAHAIVTALFDDRPLASLTDAQLADALADAAGLWEKYSTMLNRLRDDGTKVVRFGVDSHAALVKAFASCRLKILGPTKAHLLKCARHLAKIGRDAVADLARASAQDDAADPVRLLRHLVDTTPVVADLAGPGAALNSQSIILSLEAANRRVLLTGDMQFADAEVPGLDADMTALRTKVRKAGPFALVKTPHHTAYNGVSPEVLADWGPSALLAHSGGLKDPSHPASSALTAIRALGRTGAFARTDRNGQIKLDLAAPQLGFALGRGQIDDFRVNPKPTPNDIENLNSINAVPGAGSVSGGGSGSQVVWQRHERGDHVEIVALIPRQPTRVTLTIDVQPLGAVGGGSENSSNSGHDRSRLTGSTTSSSSSPGAPAVPAAPVAPFKLGGGRPFPKLLFVTSAQALAANIGEPAVAAALAAVREAGGAILDDLAPGVSVREAATRTHSALLRERYTGIVLLGGYDVVPSARLDTLTPELRQTVEADLPDADDFIVWSDAIYGDTDGDTFAELPISRVPDGKSSELFVAALRAEAGPAQPRKLAVRNARRPFATAVFRDVAGTGTELVSSPAGSANTLAKQPEMQGNVYLMLHGSDADGSALWGEDNVNGRLVEAIDVSCLPARGRGVIFTGACWGALTVTRRASAQATDRVPQSKSPDQSIALAALRAGYRAFIGCTGSHYSPGGKKADSAGGPLHKLFWSHLRAARPPAEALYLAKRDYAAKIPYRDDPIEEAVEQKILRQFTCLGLGW